MESVASPVDRAVTLSTTGCGDASATRGSGVLVSDRLVLTAAHVVIGADAIIVDSVDSDDASQPAAAIPAVVVGIDQANDLALVEMKTSLDAHVLAPQVGELPAGASARMVGGAASGTVDIEVRRRVTINVEAVRSNEVVRRAGYEFVGRIAGGDSGAGVYDDAGALVAIVFARPTVADGADRDDISFGTAGPPITKLLSARRSMFACDARNSIVVEVTNT